MARRDRVEALTRRIKGKLEELHDDREERDQARRAVHRKSVRVQDAKAELERARRRVQRRRAAVDDVRDDLAELERETPDEDTPEEQRLRALLDELAGEYEEAIAIRDRWLDRLDRARDRLSEARDALQEVVRESQEDREALERMRARRRRIQEARRRRDRPSPNFDWAEFDCNDGTPLPEGSKPAVKHWCETIGEPLRARYGSVHINSGFRHAAYNKRIGGEPNSVHIYNFPGRDFRAVAGDLTCEKGSPRDWYTFTAGEADGRGLYRTFHHADTRNRIGWPDATWTG